MPRTKRPTKKQEKSTEEDDALKKLNKIGKFHYFLLSRLMFKGIMTHYSTYYQLYITVEVQLMKTGMFLFIYLMAST